MHLLNHHDAQHSRTLALSAALPATGAAPAPPMAPKLRIFCGWVKARRDYFAEQVAAFESPKDPGADFCRIQEAAAQTIMHKLEGLGLQLPGWAAKTPAVERPCSINTLPSTQDVGHGQEVPPPAAPRFHSKKSIEASFSELCRRVNNEILSPAALPPWTASPLRTPLVPEGYAVRGQGENVRAGDLIWTGGGNIWERARPGNFGRSASVFYAVARPI